MEFVSLYKHFMMNNTSDFEVIYKQRFNSDSSLKFDIFINNFQSFFVYDVNVMSLVSRITEADKRITDIFNELPRIALSQYYRKSLIDEIEFTNQIEGVISTRKDINDLIIEIEKKIKTKNRFEGIVNKYLLLLDDKMSFKSSIDIRKLYDEMLASEIEKEDKSNLPDGTIFRKDAVSVYKTGERIVHNGVMPEEKIISYIDKALDILNDDDINALIRVALFHYFFAYIHPFYDGNGRIDRFISSYVLKENLNKVIGFRLSMTIKENLSEYLDAFVHTNDIRNRADITTFVYSFLDIVNKSYQKTELYALERKGSLVHYKEIMQNIEGLSSSEKNVLYALIQCSLFGDFGISKEQIEKYVNKKATYVSQALTSLGKKGLYITIRSGRHICYKANLDKLDLFGCGL